MHTISRQSAQWVKPCHWSLLYSATKLDSKPLFMSWQIFFHYDLHIAIPFYCFYAFPSIIFSSSLWCTCNDLLLCVVVFFGICFMDLITAENACRRVIEAERYHWAATRGVNEEMLLENLPEDLQRDIRRHLFNFVKKVRYKISGSNKIALLHIACPLITSDRWGL